MFYIYTVLQKIHIQNLAIISDLEINFSEGLTVLTGETGAGKSIILGSIQLLLGAKADVNMLHDKTKKCIVEGVFTANNNKTLLSYLSANDFDVTGNEVIVRRELSATSRTRGFINDTPCNVEQLRKVGEYLLDLHRQFDTLEIKQTDFQLEVIDTVANSTTALQNYRLVYNQWLTDTAHLQQLVAQRDAYKKDYDYNKFLYDELHALNIQPNELENIEQELGMLNNAEALKIALTYSVNALSEGDTPITSNLKSTINKLLTFTDNFKKLAGLTSRLEACLVELKDINEELIDLQDHVDIDEQKLNAYLDRFNEGNKLLSKHNVKTSEALINLKNELALKLQQSTDVESQIKTLQTSIAQSHLAMISSAATLTQQRNKSAAAISKQIEKLLPNVGMPNAQFKVQLEAKNFSSDGADKVTFLFDANNTGSLNPLSKVASGGELSRLMLCIKSLMAKAVHLPTLIFDEIDTGISGEVAKQVGIIMQELAQRHQLITVTHLPQIAAKAQKHLFVYKSITKEAGAVSTHIKTLDKQERIMQIAEMLSGNKPTETAQQTALELINS